MNNNNNKSKIDTFTGTIDALLKHTEKIDVSDFYTDEDVPMSEDDAIQYIMKKCKISSKKEAKMIYEQMKLDEVTEIVNNLVANGLLEIVGYNEDGEALYGQTELGKKYAEEILKKSNKK